MDLTWLSVLLLLNTLIYCGHSQAIHRTLVIASPQPPFFPGETVRLQCHIPEISDWRYYWFRDNQPLPRQTSATITISLPAQAGQYQCAGWKKGRPQWLKQSNILHVSVTALPKATLTINLNPVYPGETVTLTCSVGSYTDWRYKWYKDRNDNVVSQSGSSNPGASYTISITSVSDQGQYWCEGHRVSRPTSSQPSTAITLTVLDLPTASVSVSPNGLLYSGETVTLQCDISDYTDWTSCWYRNKQQLSPGSPSKTITTLSDQVSQYQCQGRRTDRPQSSQLSVSLHISVTTNQPKATLSSDQKDILTGDSVTLICTVESSGWRFYWYRHRQDSEPVATTSGSSYTLSQVSVSDGGQYRCRAGRGDPVYYTQYSEPVHIQVTERPVAVLTLQPNWTQIFKGETVPLRCVIKWGEDKDWEYKWFKESHSIYSKTNPEYTISPVNTSHTGSFTCLGVKENTFSRTSDAVQLTVSDQPKAVLSIAPQWMNPGDSVTLNCEVKESSTGWRFSWYKTVPYRAGLPSLLDKSYSVEPLSGYGTTEESYTLSPAGPTDTGGYVCRAGRGDPVYYTDYSEPQFLWSGGSPVSISLSRLLCGLLVVSPFLLVSIILMVKCYRAGGFCSTAKFPEDELRCDYLKKQTDWSL